MSANGAPDRRTWRNDAFDHQRMRGADGKYAARLAGLVTRDEIEVAEALNLCSLRMRRQLADGNPFALAQKNVQAYC